MFARRVIQLLLAGALLAACGAPAQPDAADLEATIEARLQATLAAQPPTPTSAPPTNTPQPTQTPSPTPQATHTPEPTQTPSPTSTPEPTDTPVPPTPTLPIVTRNDMPSPTSGLQQATVVDVTDGDTIRVDIGGTIERVRFIGIDTPESVDPNSPVECFGVEASNHTRQLLSGATVYLESDPSQDSRDRYNRILRYVWLDDGTLVNLALIRDGYAFEYTYQTPYRYQAEFQQAQRDAEAEEVGLWSPATCNGQQIEVQPTATPVPPTAIPPPPRPTQPAPAPAAPASQCDPSYPTVCIPPRSLVGDLDCKDVAYSSFRVLPPDPHGFDGNDNDGLGCESN